MNDERAGRLAGRRVIVTGAASGIGRATARLLHSEGARLALMDQAADNLALVAQELGAEAVVLDLAISAGIEASVAAAAAAMQGIDGIVIAAGMSQPAPLEQIDDALLHRFLAINLAAPFVICRCALPHLRRAEQATIVNISSGHALLPNAPDNSAYAATKGGLITLSKALASELAPRIRVNAVCPGVTNTPMTAGLISGYASPLDAPLVQKYALKRVAEPEEIARAVLFLSCDDSSYVTGTAMAVDGGRSYH